MYRQVVVDLGEAEITIHGPQWVSGTRAASYQGPVNARGKCLSPAGFERLLRRCCRRLAEKAHKLGANAVCGAEYHIDPFSSYHGLPAIELSVAGTSATLMPLAPPPQSKP